MRSQLLVALERHDNAETIENIEAKIKYYIEKLMGLNKTDREIESVLVSDLSDSNQYAVGYSGSRYTALQIIMAIFSAFKQERSQKKIAFLTCSNDPQSNVSLLKTTPISDTRNLLGLVFEYTGLVGQRSAMK